ncbi:hypothetical protein H0A36_01945 [Endozoicomonas sp. SM1973]|uniref:Solute-binding protein family 3/N-terminal domain-containing protein n=1 Tax=Spartinivicinus marinus TaxID=2994442 RepID=A0A853HSI4_9GAMM|nr:hypothetical protein [Spartinivicinus marinus]MCX4030006.1 hypothetical protein [Spartinivicinus marinus]NYZ64750.1 hypothetical protein [Spartinivicinus marinus]
MKTTAVIRMEQVIRLVNEDRVEIGVLPRIDLINLSERLGIKVNIFEPPLANIPLYHYLHKKHQSLVPKVAEALKQLRAEQQITPLVLKYYKEASL